MNTFFNIEMKDNIYLDSRHNAEKKERTRIKEEEEEKTRERIPPNVVISTMSMVRMSVRSIDTKYNENLFFH